MHFALIDDFLLGSRTTMIKILEKVDDLVQPPTQEAIN